MENWHSEVQNAVANSGYPSVEVHTELKDEFFCIDIVSDRLSLPDMIVLEKSIKASLHQNSPADLDPVIKIRFKRNTPISPDLKPKHSQAVAPKGFGIIRTPTPIPNIDKVLAISSGEGGVGKSTLTVQLALSLTKLGKKVGILDADIYGPSCHLMMGLHNQRHKVNSQGQLIPVIQDNIHLASFGFLTGDESPVIWRGPMVSKALKQLAFTTEWPKLDILLIDMPPGTGDIPLTLVESLPLSGAVIVSTPQKIAMIDATKGLNLFKKMNIPVLGWIENMSGKLCKVCGHFEEVLPSILSDQECEEFPSLIATRRLGVVPMSESIAQSCDRGSREIYPSIIPIANLIVETLDAK